MLMLNIAEDQYACAPCNGLRLCFSLEICPPSSIYLDPAFFSDLAAHDIIYKGNPIGVIGVVHPLVLAKFGLKNPCGLLLSLLFY